MVTNFFLDGGVNYAYALNNGTLFVDAKPILKSVFSSATNYIVELAKHPEAQTEGGRTPLWVPINVLANFFADKHNASRIEGATFDFATFKNNLFDFLYDSGNTAFISERRKAAEAAKAAEIARANELAVEKLTAELERMKAAEAARVENEKEKARAKVNPVIRVLNDAWFPIILSIIFASVIGGFSYEILSQTIGMPKYLNAALACAFVLFPLATSIRQFTFDFGDLKIQPLWIVMFVDMVFTAYHVGWLRSEQFQADAQMASLHPVLKTVFMIIIPLMQKGTNEMLLKIRATYLVKGYLPKVD